jgi:plastocyanin
MRRQSFKLVVVVWTSFSLLSVQRAWSGIIDGRISGGGLKTDLSNFVVSVEDIDGPFPSPNQTSVPQEMDQKELRFVPHVLPIMAGTTVDFPNNDPVSHNVFSISETKRFNLGLYGRGMKRSIRFDQPGIVELLCNVHMEMSGFIVVLKNPYFAKSGADGSFRISGVPGGRHRLRCWNEESPAREVEITVPSEGVVNVNFEMNSSPLDNKTVRHDQGVPRR